MKNDNQQAREAARFTKKPVTIRAIQLEDSEASIKAVESFLEGCPITTDSQISQDKFSEYCEMLRKQGGRIIHTLEGDHLARFGDWIIRGVKGEFYPCKPDIFELTYESAALTAKAEPPPSEGAIRQLLNSHARILDGYCVFTDDLPELCSTHNYNQPCPVPLANQWLQSNPAPAESPAPDADEMRTGDVCENCGHTHGIGYGLYRCSERVMSQEHLAGPYTICDCNQFKPAAVEADAMLERETD